MKIGAFEIYEPIPELKRTYAFSTIVPWIDVGDVGSLTIHELLRNFNAKELGRLKIPGKFFDFTRYRPHIIIKGDIRGIHIPNTPVYYAEREENDLLFLRCLEPHMNGEEYVDSIVKILEKFNVESYHVIGSLYDYKPHTRPLVITGNASKKEMEDRLRKLNVLPSSYEGPTSILALISSKAQEHGIGTINSIVHIPAYIRLDEDYMVTYRLLDMLCSLYDFRIDLEEIKKIGEEQYKEIDDSIRHVPQFPEAVKILEEMYDRDSSQVKLPPEIEKFLKELEQRGRYQ